MHDPVLWANTGQVGRLEITAQRKPVAEMKPVTEESLLADRTLVYK